MVGCRFSDDTRFIDTHFRAGANFTGSVFAERPFFRVMHADQARELLSRDLRQGRRPFQCQLRRFVPLRHQGRGRQPTLYRSEVFGTLRLMATLQRDPQPLGRELELSATNIGYLVISAGDQRNRGEYTGPARGNRVLLLFHQLFK